MNEKTINRIIFFDQLHEAFMSKKGYGAFAYISVKDAMHLFDRYSGSNEDMRCFINHYIRTL